MTTYETSSSKISVADYQETLRAARECDLVFTSPPYEGARTYGAGVVWTFEDYQRLGDATFAALRPGGHAILVLDGPVRDWRPGKGSERSLTPWRVLIDWADRIGFRVPERMAYGRMGGPGAYHGRFRNDWEPLLWFQRPGAKGFFDKWAIAGKAKYQATSATNRRVDGGMNRRRVSGKAVEAGLKHRGTYWDYGHVGNKHDEAAAEATKHPARFCMKLAVDVVRCFAPPGGLVCDPMVGSGATAVAAVRYGRRFIGGDLHSNETGVSWASIAHERVLLEISSQAPPTA